MAASKASILHALENSVFAFPELPGRWEVPSFWGVRAHATPETSHPIGNLVGVATLTEANADAVIAQVQDFFATRHHRVGWWVNPSSTPGDLVIRLEAAGFSKVIAQAGQVLTNMGCAIKVNPVVTVRQATQADRDELIHLYATAYPLPEAMAAVITDVVPLAAGGRHYLAFLDGVKRPVAVASMFPFPKSTIAVMQGAATLSQYRGHGVYTALMATRLADARALGMEAAILQADRTTSAPICANLGFEEVCSIDLYVWENG
jgi:N-acetylglutamate synthase-like GNAT family acetyltransferase